MSLKIYRYPSTRTIVLYHQETGSSDEVSYDASGHVQKVSGTGEIAQRWCGDRGLPALEDLVRPPRKEQPQ